jgi:glycosyltransferase involved in cell wall biosynthesis
MKKIIMVQGTGINERGWASLISQYGRVTLIQIGLLKHVEIWENGQRTYCGPEIKINYWLRKFDQALLGPLLICQTIFLILKSTRGAKADLVIASSPSSGIACVLLEKLGYVGRTVFFLCDHLPPKGSFLVKLHRRLANWMGEVSSKWSDEAWGLSPRIHAVQANKNHFVVPIPINYFPTQAGPRQEIGYIGYPSYDHALDILFEICTRHHFRLNIIGDSPYLQSIKHLAPPETHFHGLLNDAEQIGKILANCFCGYAIYRDTSPNSYSYYGFPSKIFYCFASNVPIVITNVAWCNDDFEKNGVGRVVKPVPEEIEKAILQLKENYAAYSQAIDRFRPDWNAGVEQFHRERLTALFQN